MRRLISPIVLSLVQLHAVAARHRIARRVDPDRADGIAGGFPLAVVLEPRDADYLAQLKPGKPGFGHRFHPVDPRCAPLLALVEEARLAGLVSGRYAVIGRAVEEGIRRRTGKPIPMNIDGVTAVIFCELGFPAPLGRGLFILSRSVGILSHAWEEMSRGTRMKGPMPKTIPYTYNGPGPRKPDTDRSA